MMKNYLTIWAVFASLLLLAPVFIVSANDDNPQKKKKDISIEPTKKGGKNIIIKEVAVDGKVTIDTIKLEGNVPVDTIMVKNNGKTTNHVYCTAITRDGKNFNIITSDLDDKVFMLSASTTTDFNFWKPKDKHKTMIHTSKCNNGGTVVETLDDEDENETFTIDQFLGKDAKKNNSFFDKNDPSIIKYERKMIGDNKEKIVIIRKIEKKDD